MSAREHTRLGAFDVLVARTEEEVEALRPSWKELQAERLGGDIDHFLTVARTDPEVVRPHVVLLERDGRPEGLVAARIKRIRLRCRLGYRKLYEPPVRALAVVHGGLLGPLSRTDPGSLLAAVHSGLERREIDVVRLPAVATESLLATALATKSPRWRRSSSEPRRHWRAHLPGSYEEFLRSLSSSTRQGARRNAAKLERAHPELELRRFVTGDDLDEFLAAASAVADTTYQRNLGVAISDDDGLQHAIVALGADRGWFRGLVLYLDGEPAAFWYGFAYRGVFQTAVPGYDPRYGRLNIGMVVLLKLVEELCADESISMLDFGFGDAEYKRRLGDESWLEQDVLVFEPTLRAIRINTIRSSLLTGVGLGRRAVAAAGTQDRIKKVWRRRLAAPESTQA